MRAHRAAALGAAVCLLAACSGGIGSSGGPALGPDAASVALVVHGDGAVGADSLLACALRVAPAGGAGETAATAAATRAGGVTGCTNVHDAQPDLQLRLPPGRHVLQAVRAACPGMPGDCPEDPYADLYSGPQGGAVLWACVVPVQLAPRQAATVTVDLETDDDGGGGVRARCSLT